MCKLWKKVNGFVQNANGFRAGPRHVDEKSKPNMFREGPRKVNFASPSAPTANTDQVPYRYTRSEPPSAVAEPQQAQTTPTSAEAHDWNVSSGLCTAVAVPHETQQSVMESGWSWTSKTDWWEASPPSGANGMQDGEQDRVNIKVGCHDN